MSTNLWVAYRWVIIEVFVIVNLAFLALDVYLAHSINHFREPTEWIPVCFSLAAPVLLAAGNLWAASDRRGMNHAIGLLVGFTSILIGVTGIIFHLESQFFARHSLRSLVYTAPFAAPLAYCGLGFLLLLNRMVSEESKEWSQWLIFFGLGGFGGNFVLALCDHAQNGFFHPLEWIPVISAAYTVGFLAVALYANVTQAFLNVCFSILAIQFLVGMVGFYLHTVSSLQGTSTSLFQNMIHGAPIFAPLLFPNLAVLSGFGIWDLRSKLKGTAIQQVA